MPPPILATCWTTAGDAAPLEGRRLSPLSLPARIAAASAAGFTGFGIGHADLACYLESASLAELRSVLTDHGIETVELEFLADWWTVGEARRASDERLELLRHCAYELGARDVKIGADEENDAYDLGHWAEQFVRVCDAFAEVGTVVALEFTAFSNIPTLMAARELVDTAGHPNGGLMLDVWHLERGGYTFDELADLPLIHIKGVELDDGTAAASGDPYLDTINNRLLPGEGGFDLDGFVRTLAAVGWDGPWGVEIFSETHRHQDLADSLPKVYRTTLETLARGGVS